MGGENPILAVVDIIVTTCLYLIFHFKCIKDLFVSFSVNCVKTKVNTALVT